MAATNSTTNLGLPQWVATDKPEMTDFNTAMSDIDNTVASHLAENVSQGNPHGIDAKANKAMGTYFAATLQNGWTGDLYYAKNDLGQVHLYSNNLTIGTVVNGTVIASLPSEFKPVSATVPLLAYNTSSAQKITGIDIFKTRGLVTYAFTVMAGQAIRIDTIYQA